MTWTNDDGLIVKFRAEEATAGKGGAYNTFGPNHCVELKVTGTDIVTTAGTVLDQHTAIPANARIEKVEIAVGAAFTSAGAATLNVGLVEADLATEIDNDGLVAALALTAIDADGDVVELVQGSTGHGALVGTKLTEAGFITINWGTAAYTAGDALIRVYYRQEAA